MNPIDTRTLGCSLDILLPEDVPSSAWPVRQQFRLGLRWRSCVCRTVDCFVIGKGHKKTVRDWSRRPYLRSWGLAKTSMQSSAAGSGVSRLAAFAGPTNKNFMSGRGRAPISGLNYDSSIEGCSLERLTKCVLKPVACCHIEKYQVLASKENFKSFQQFLAH
ncbi:hypothetical protein PCASD_25039 [Puccinia coronata f. sp. avenae]|uniref:Uncharacterized protein n=1 Tax=Puccinia coronata f. sp. avenae TaxID=200324 RepID=A0A2N5SLN3_9BASI|nr:hypothetical protein PCASD_25039 [Puccinia coronata f. sp. avenae]